MKQEEAGAAKTDMTKFNERGQRFLQMVTDEAEGLDAQEVAHLVCQVAAIADALLVGTFGAERAYAWTDDTLASLTSPDVHMYHKGNLRFVFPEEDA